MGGYYVCTIYVHAISFSPNHVTPMYMFIKSYKWENMKIGKDDDAAAALGSLHTAIVQAVGLCLGARTFRRQLKRRLRGALCTTPNTILLYIFACAQCILVGDGGTEVSNNYYIILAQTPPPENFIWFVVSFSDIRTN